jgi:hypothetical protein
MALGDSYASLLEVKARLGIGDTTEDTQLTAVLAVASRGIEQCCNRQFNDAGSASARVFHIDHPRLAIVDDFHTTDGLIVATDAAGAGAFGTTWNTTDYELAPLGGIVDGVPGWPYWRIRGIDRYFPCASRRASLQVTARWGWAAVPAPVKEATLILAEDIFKLKSAPFGVSGYSEYGRVRARQNPEVWLRVSPYVRNRVLVA